MSTKKITYEKKAPFQTDENIPEINQVTSDNLNEIKDVVNINADELESKQPKEQGKGLSTNDFTNEFKNKLENLNNYDDKEITSKVTNLEENVVNIQKKQTTQNKDIEDLKTDNKKNKTDLQTIKQEQQDQNSKIENNTTENKDNTELLNQIMGLLPSAKGEGEHVTLQDTGEARFKKFEMQGNSKQETRSGKNLLNIVFPTSTIQGLTITNNGNGSITLNGTNKSNDTLYINLNIINANLDYAFEINNEIYSMSVGVPLPAGINVCLRTIENNNSFIRITTGEKNKENILVNTKGKAQVYLEILQETNFNNLTLYPMIVKDTTCGEFEQYGASPSPEFPSKIRNVGDNVNLLNIDKDFTVTTFKEIKVNLEPGIYTISFENTESETGANFSILFKDNNSTQILFRTVDTSQLKNLTFELSAKCTSMNIYSGINYDSSEGKTRTFKKMKIEEGTHATAYSPYNCGNVSIKTENADKTQSEEKIFPFTEGQRLYKGDFLAEDGVHHTRKKIVLDGTEAWGQYNRGTTDFFGVALKVSDIKSGQTIMCNKLTEDGSKIYSTNGEAVGCLTDNYLYICIKRVRIGATINTAFEECLELFKQYLTNCYNKGEPFIIEYGLINEENEPYTPEQQEAHKQLKKLHSYNEQTNIFSKDEISSVFNVEAIKNLNATFAQLSATMLERS